MALSCPVLVKPDCGKCGIAHAKCLAEGTECCCPAAYECVPCPCDPPKAVKCRACERMITTTTACGCIELSCEPVTPTCEPCFELVAEEYDSEGCPVHQCKGQSRD